MTKNYREAMIGKQNSPNDTSSSSSPTECNLILKLTKSRNVVKQKKNICPPHSTCIVAIERSISQNIIHLFQPIPYTFSAYCNKFFSSGFLEEKFLFYYTEYGGSRSKHIVSSSLDGNAFCLRSCCCKISCILR